MKLKFLVFWAINGDLDINRLCKQLHKLKESGFTGVVFHPRYYTNNPEYMSRDYCNILSELILYAKAISMEFWIYDENGWPSGHASGKVYERVKRCECKWISYENGEIKINSYKDVNTFSEEDMAAFVDITYEGYKRGLNSEAFDYVKGFFSDEVGFLDGHGISMQTGGIPWHDSFEVKYKELYGESLTDSLESLFVEKGDYQRIRSRFWEIAADRLADNYYKRINDWCTENGKRYTAHLKGEENIFFQISPSGSAYRNLIRINTPGIDALERYPGNNYYPRIVSSLSKQFSDGVCMSESIGGSGWGLGPDDFIKYVEWLLKCGINMFVFHICQYHADANSVYDWPPNFPLGLNWKDSFPAILEKLHRKWDNHVINHNKVLVVAPTRGVMRSYNPADARVINEHNGAGVPNTTAGLISNNFGKLTDILADRGIDFDVTEEWIVDQFGKIEDNKLTIGNEQYDYIIMGSGAYFENSDIIKDMALAGILHKGEEFCWKINAFGINQLILKNTHNSIRINISNASTMSIYTIENLKSVRCMGQALGCIKEGDSAVYIIGESLIRSAMEKGYLDVDFVPDTLKSEKEEYYVYLRGHFGVYSSSGYIDEGRLMYTDSEFYIQDEPSKFICDDLYGKKDFIKLGFPFMQDKIILNSKFYVGTDKCLKIMDDNSFAADIAEVIVDGVRSDNYVYRNHLCIYNISEGLHDVCIEMVPSTYNMYGPHHYYRGDHYLISPAQYKGEKNFVDETSVSNSKVWKSGFYFVKYGIF